MGSLAGMAFKLDAATMIGNGALADAQSQSGPFADGLGGEERVGGR
jgi:hypothetical protein